MWNDIKRIDDAAQNVAKFVFTKDDAVAEAVLYKYPTYDERTVICCSTQSGCPVGCRFCGAGDYFVRSLTAEEIVSQSTHCLMEVLRTDLVKPEQIKRLQIMFMSMGEPLLNLHALNPAIRQLHNLYPQAALLVSTIGPNVGGRGWDDFLQVCRDVPTVGLQFSVHEAHDSSRNKLIPFAKKMTLDEIAIIGAAWRKWTGRKPFFNYCAHDHNVSLTDAQLLVDRFSPKVWNATVSVVCERSEGLPATNQHQRDLAIDFAARLVDKGFDTRVFDPAGQDTIGGGCGQLWFAQQWMRDNPDKARPSVGHGLPEVHAPAQEVA